MTSGEARFDPAKAVHDPVATRVTGKCGWCLTRRHDRCLGKRRDDFDCTCEVCK